MTALIAAHLWQSTLIVVGAWGLALLCKRNGADLRFVFWLGATVKFLVPLAALQWLGDRFGQSLAQSPPVSPALLETANAILALPIAGHLQLSEQTGSQLETLALLIWVTGTLLLSWRWWRQWRSLRSILRESRRLVLDFPVPVQVTATDLAPGVFGIWRPVVMLPESVVRQLDAPQLTAVLAHELCHIRRRDNLWAAVHKCVETLFWFHPLVWLIGTQLVREREAACDESVIDAGHEQRVYAESILNVCRWSLTARSPEIAASGGDLTQRIRTIMRLEPARPLDDGRMVLLLSAVLVVCFAPIVTGIISGGARRAAADRAPVSFTSLRLRAAQSNWQSSTHFDAANGHVRLENVSLRTLIHLAYPAAWVAGDLQAIDNLSYDIEADWPSTAAITAPAAYRELVRRVLQTDVNVQLYVDQQCEMACS